MIEVTKINGTQLIANCDLIVTVESTPDTIITLMNGEKLTVKETPDEIVRRSIAYHRRSHFRDVGNAREVDNGQG